MTIAGLLAGGSVIAEIARRALAGEAPDALLVRATEAVCETLGAEAAHIIELADGGSSSRVRAAAGELPALLDGGVAQAWREQVCTPDGPGGRPAEIELPGGGCALVAAIPRAAGGPFGLLVVARDGAAGFTEHDVEFTDSVALVLATVIEQRHAAQEVRHRALHDPLTGLPNRELFADRVAHALRVGDGRRQTAVLVLDIDRFKLLNDAFGLLAGDALLEAFAQRLRTRLRPADTLARLGGDEFAILCEELDGERDAIAAAQAVLDALAAPFSVGEQRLVVSASIGIVVGDGTGHTADALIRDADVAMYRAKDQGGSRYELFDHAMRRRVVERLGLESDMRRALERGEFTLFFQPIVSTAERRIAGVEALVRWEHPELGVVPPSAFIPVAEESGLIVPLGRWVLNEACRRLARWLADPAIDVPYLSVNISGRQLADPALPDEVASVLRRTGVPADRLALEITESVLIGGTASPTAVLQRLEQLGVRLLLDDFGTGYSSLNYLKRLPVQALKVDRSFIAGITEDAEDRHILRAIVDMAAGLGVGVVAEGVETVEQALCVRSLGCETLQGYLFAAPVPAEAIEPMLRGGLPLDRLAPAFAPTAPATRAALPAAAADPEPGPPPATADDGPSVALSEAAQALSVSTSTLRRWADAGRIRSVRTAGGHRRFPVAEIRRLNSEGRACGSPVVRAVALPAEPLPALAALLRDATAEISDASARALYERPRLGWFASDDGEAQVRRWALAVAAAAQDGSFDGAIDATAQLLAQAHYAGASLLERHTFIERYGDVAVRALQQRNAPHAELIAARRLYVRLRQALLDEPFAGRA